MERIELAEAPELSARFPAERYARVLLTLRDGRELASGDTVARGSAENPLDDDELMRKYHDYAVPVIGAPAAARIAQRVAALDRSTSLEGLLDDLLEAPAAQRAPA
jgi:2-methylcitrate dehydratase PrpD